MNIASALDRYPDGPDEIACLFARMQRDRFTGGLRPGFGIVEEVIPAGSLARSAPDGPDHVDLHVDLIVVLPPGVLRRLSPAEALVLTQQLIGVQVHGRALTDPGLGDGTRIRDQVVECDWAGLPLGAFEGLVPAAPPVDVMPAYRAGTQLLVPDIDYWTTLDPGRMTRMVAERQREWEHFTDLLRMVRVWAGEHDLGLRSVAAEILVLAFMPRPGRWQTLTRAEALARFFECAADRLDVLRTSGTGAVVDPGPDYARLRAALCEGAEVARAAVDAATDGAQPQAEAAWKTMFGDAFGPGWLIATLRWVWGGRPSSSPAEVRSGWPARGPQVLQDASRPDSPYRYEPPAA